jgi:hypothetical protein
MPGAGSAVARAPSHACRSHTRIALAPQHWIPREIRPFKFATRAEWVAAIPDFDNVDVTTK